MDFKPYLPLLIALLAIAGSWARMEAKLASMEGHSKDLDVHQGTSDTALMVKREISPVVDQLTTLIVQGKIAEHQMEDMIEKVADLKTELAEVKKKLTN